MQISTREEDFIIDTLELRSEMYILNESFTNPSIVKVRFASLRQIGVSLLRVYDVIWLDNSSYFQSVKQDTTITGVDKT